MTEEFQRGVIPLARYQEQQLPEYQDNPLISALPPIPDLQEVVGLLQQLPGFEPQEALLDGRSGHMQLPACCTASSSR